MVSREEVEHRDIIGEDIVRVVQKYSAIDAGSLRWSVLYSQQMMFSVVQRDRWGQVRDTMGENGRHSQQTDSPSTVTLSHGTVTVVAALQ